MKHLLSSCLFRVSDSYPIAQDNLIPSSLSYDHTTAIILSLPILCSPNVSHLEGKNPMANTKLSYFLRPLALS